MTDQQLIYALALQHVPKIGPTTAKKLINHCGSVEAVLKEKMSNLLKIDGIGTVTIQGLFDKTHIEEAESELRFIKDNNLLVHYFTEDTYPEKLKHCIDGPIVLFQYVKINLKKQRIISIVGDLKITTSGIAFCEKLVESLAQFNPVIVSGFAYGTDI
ncbi:MAG: DNA-processing protein DprA, partial [Winogradskyella sp.]